MFADPRATPTSPPQGEKGPPPEEKRTLAKPKVVKKVVPEDAGKARLERLEKRRRVSLSLSLSPSLFSSLSLSLSLPFFLSLSLSLSRARGLSLSPALSLAGSVASVTRNSVGVQGASARARAKREQLERFSGLLSESQGQNLALNVLYVPDSLDSGV